MKLTASGLTDPGRVHDVNEDAFLVDEARGLFLVSDGVGRYKGAALASETVVATAAEALRSPAPVEAESRRRWLIGAAKKAGVALAAAAKKQRALASMAATLTLLQVIGDEGHLVHLGDSRAYLFRAGELAQLTRDHSVAFEQFEAGAITKDQLRTHPNQRLLTRSIRASSTLVLPEVSALALLPGDLVLLCSDGLTKDLPDETLAAALRAGDDLPRTVRGLVDAANAAGGGDNVTVVLVRCEA